MANMLKSVREEARVLLAAAGVTVYEYIPARISPPAAVMEPGNPYIEQGQTFSEFNVRLSVVLVAGQSSNEKATDDLDQLICSAMDALDTFDIESVEQPATYDFNGAQLLGARVNLVTNKDLMI